MLPLIIFTIIRQKNWQKNCSFLANRANSAHVIGSSRRAKQDENGWTCADSRSFTLLST